MLHQLLFALLGKPGAIFRLDSKGFMVDRSLNLFKPQQETLLNQIIHVGYNYNILNQFVQAEIYHLFDYGSYTRREPSVYRQAFAAGLESMLQQYVSLIQDMENTFLQHKHFTIGNMKADLVKYELLFPDIKNLIDSISINNLRGGSLVDFIYQKYRTGNNWLRQCLAPVLQKCYDVLINQINAWILYGEIVDKHGQFFVHRVTFEPVHKFKFSNKNVRQVDITDWQMYTLQAAMIPSSLLSPSTAGKILFIGKSTKILRSCQKIPILPSEGAINEAKILQGSKFQQNQLQQVIQRIRLTIAHKMITLILNEQQFLKELQKVNEYFLMCRGDFYHLLLEQSKGLDKIPQKQKALRKLNEQYLQNAFMRLNSFEDSKKVSFELRPLGFKIDGFRTFNHLCPVGNIDLIDGKSIRFNGSDGAVWHKTKQLVENDFHMGCLFRFKKYPRYFKEIKLEENKPNIPKAVLSIVLQNSQEVSPNSHANPHSLNFLDQYLTIDIGFISNQKQTQYYSFMKIVALNIKNGGKPVLLANTQLKKVNFHDESLYHIKLSYRENAKDKNFRVSIGSSSNQNHDLGQLNIDLSIPFYLKTLEMGRSHVGFISNLLGPDYCAQIQQWEMICTAPNHYGDHWSDICLHFKIAWPLDLVLTSDLLDNFTRVHKFLFPLRQTQIDLQQIWPRIPRRIKQEPCSNKLQRDQMRIFERRLSGLRSKICLVVSQLWNYFQADVIESSWGKLTAALGETADFQHLIGMVNKYIKSIQKMFFFNVPKIQNSINLIIRQGKDFIRFFSKLQQQNINEEDFSRLEEIKDNFDDIFYELLETLKQLSNISGTHYLFHLTQRMTSCSYNEKIEGLRAI